MLTALQCCTRKKMMRARVQHGMHVTIPKRFPWSGGDGRSGRTEQ